MWFVYSLAALLCWSGSDLFSKLGSGARDKYSHWKLVMAVGLVMGLHALYELTLGGVSITFADIIRYLPASALYITSMILGYVALRYIELSLSSPICNSSGAIVCILCLIFLDQKLVGLQIAGVIAVCVGVVGLGFVEFLENDDARSLRQLKSNRKYSKSWIAVILPILYCFLDAGGTFADTVILETLDETVANVAYELTFLFMGVCAFIYIVIIKRQPIRLKPEAPKLAAALFETAGQFAYIFAIAAYAVGAAPIISAYCVLSVVWSRIFLKEKLSWKHYAVIIIVFAGILLLGIAEGLEGG